MKPFPSRSNTLNASRISAKMDVKLTLYQRWKLSQPLTPHRPLHHVIMKSSESNEANLIFIFPPLLSSFPNVLLPLSLFSSDPAFPFQKFNSLSHRSLKLKISILPIDSFWQFLEEPALFSLLNTFSSSQRLVPGSLTKSPLNPWTVGYRSQRHRQVILALMGVASCLCAHISHQKNHCLIHHRGSSECSTPAWNSSTHYTTQRKVTLKELDLQSSALAKRKHTDFNASSGTKVFE